MALDFSFFPVFIRAIRGFVLFSCMAALATAPIALTSPCVAAPWARHTIDDTAEGADGVRLADANGDGLLDIATGFEEAGLVRVYLNPGPRQAREPWPSVTVGRVGSPEDAVLVDVDGDGALDVVSSCEGRERSLFVHWAPASGGGAYLDSRLWSTEAIGSAAGAMRWMFAAALQVGGRGAVNLIAGGKDEGATIGWFEAPLNPRDLAAWKFHRLRPVGWVMSIRAGDMDGDGDADVLFSDRKGEASGVSWLENPGPDLGLAETWREHGVGSHGEEVMFVTEADLDGDGLQDVIAAVRPRAIHFHRRLCTEGRTWETHKIELPAQAGGAKGVAAGDVDGDGRIDLVFTCERAREGRSGVMWLSYDRSPAERRWRAHEISGPEGVKFDLVELIDLDGDGDLDVLTCEEAEGLGVVWYENPTVIDPNRIGVLGH